MIRRLPAVFFWLIWVLACAARSFAGEANSAVADALSRKLLSPAIPLQEIKDFVDAHLLPMPEPKTVADWERYANRVRKEALDRVIFRGEAAKWRTLPTRREMAGNHRRRPRLQDQEATLRSCPGPLDSRTPLRADRVQVSQSPRVARGQWSSSAGKSRRLQADPLHQPGQARHDRFEHGISGFRTTQRPEFRSLPAQPTRAVRHERRVTVLSRDVSRTRHPVGARSCRPDACCRPRPVRRAWQTITISSLDIRVTLCNPVAGYGPLSTRMRYLTDTGNPNRIPAILRRSPITHR